MIELPCQNKLRGDKLKSCRLLDIIVMMKTIVPEPNHHQTELSKILDVQLNSMIELFFGQNQTPNRLRISGLMSSLKSMRHKDPFIRSRGKG